MGSIREFDGSRESWGRMDGRLLASGVILAAILAVNLFRATHQTVVHDEALTYNHWVVLPWNAIRWTVHSNNHTLNSLLIKASTEVFGLTSLTLRLPALLGGLLYLLAAERLCRRACRGTAEHVTGLLALTVSPFVLDYLVAARGYSMALGFLMWALVLSWEWADRREPRQAPSRTRRFALVSLLCGLSVASNLAFALAAAALLIVLWTAALTTARSPRWSEAARSALILSLPGGTVFLLIVPGVFRLHRETLFFGATTWTATMKSLLQPLFGGFGTPGTLPWLRTASMLGVPFLMLLLGGLAAWAGARQFLPGDGRTPDGNAGPGTGPLLVLTGSVLLVTILLHTLAHLLAGILLPMERTGIFFVPLGFLTALLVPGSLPGGTARRAAGGLVRATFSLFVVLFLCFGHIRYFQQWKYDADSRNVFLAVQDLARRAPGASIGNDWLLEPSLNFYRTFYHATELPRFTRRLPTIDDTIFALLPRRDVHDRRILASLPLRIVLADPLSGAVVGARVVPGGSGDPAQSRD